MNWDEIRERWDGPRWYWWALIVSIGLIIATAALAAAVAALLGQDLVPLFALGLVIELMVISVIGSGMLDGLSRRMTPYESGRKPASSEIRRPRAGGRSLSGEQDTSDDDEEEPEDPEEERKRKEQERKTLRMGMMALPILVTFLVLLFG